MVSSRIRPLYPTLHARTVRNDGDCTGHSCLKVTWVLSAHKVPRVTFIFHTLQMLTPSPTRLSGLSDPKGKLGLVEVSVFTLPPEILCAHWF